MVLMFNVKWSLISVTLLIATSTLTSCQLIDPGTSLDPLTILLQDILPALLNQSPANENGTMAQNEQLALEDNVNDEFALSEVQDMITAAGFEFENHYVISADGYITQLVNIINRLVDRSKLKQPPVLLFHGGLINPTIYALASIKQHHPEKYPRSAEDGPITSSNRSIAFTLANNGYDVWIIGTRGSSPANRGYIAPSDIATVLRDGLDRAAQNTILEDIVNAVTDLATGYWLYSQDELIQLEIPKQIDTVLEITGAKNVSILTYSLSTLMSLNLFGSYEEQAAKIHNYIPWAPPLNLDGSNDFWKLFVATLCLPIEENLGTIYFTQTLNSQNLREFFVTISQSKYVRYSIYKSILNLLLGASAKYETFLELPVVGHIFEPLSFMQLKHYCQQATLDRTQMYDYGPLQNLLKYGTVEPTPYNISNIHIENWLLVSGANDQLGTPGSVRKVLAEVNPKPYKHLDIGPYNHADFPAAFDNDRQVNLPILEFLDTFAIYPNEDSEE